jgi:hypothetical protein
MINYQEEPLPLLDVANIKNWLGTKDADLFKACVTAQMHQHYFDAINARSNLSQVPTDEDVKRSETLALTLTRHGDAIHQFLKTLQRFAKDDYKFRKLKVTT